MTITHCNILLSKKSNISFGHIYLIRIWNSFIILMNTFLPLIFTKQRQRIVTNKRGKIWNLESYILYILNNSTKSLISKYSYFTINFLREINLHILSSDVAHKLVRLVSRYYNFPSNHTRRVLDHSSHNSSLRKTLMPCTDPW